MVEYAPSNEPEAGKRRSTRVVQAIPITVTGVDALGQPFRERTSTLIVNCHGFKYQSKHYVLKGSGLEIEVPDAEAGKPPRKVHCQVTFVQRPRSAKELFQVGVEMNTTGNVWGIAFPPEDWTPFAVTTREDELHPPRPPAGAGEAVAGNIGAPSHTMPPAMATDIATNIHRQVTRMLADAQEQIQRVAREAALAAISRETATLLRDLNIQLKVAAEKAVEQSSTNYTEQALRKAFKKIDEARESGSQELRGKWAQEFERDLQQSKQHVLGKLAESVDALRADWSERISSDVAVGKERLKEVEDRLAAIHQQKEEEEASALNAWRTRLEQDIAEASARLGEAQREMISSAEEKLAKQLAKEAAYAVHRVDADLDKRGEEIRALVAAATSEVEKSANAGRASLDEKLLQGRAFVAEVEAIAGHVQKDSRQLEEQARKAGAEHVQQFEELLAKNRAKLERQAEGVLARLTQRLEPALAERGAEVVARVAAEVEKQVAPRLHSAEEAIQKLKEEEATVLEMLQQEQARLQSEFETASQAVLARCLAELEAKSDDATHETFEQLFKSAEWYQRKAQNSMQTAFEKGMTQVTANLREKAGEVSTLFAAELDHYSRSYSEHTQGLLEEAAKETTARMRGQILETSEAGAAQFSDEIHRLAEDKAERLRATSEIVVQEAQAGLAAHVENVRRELDTRSAQSTLQFQQTLAERLRLGVSEAMQEFQQRLVPVLENWRAEARRSQEQWLVSLDRKRDESVEQFKQRLENVSNAWMVAAVTTLNQHSQGVLDSMAQTVEQRLRHTCADVFAGVGETMRQKLLEISTDLKKGASD